MQLANIKIESVQISMVELADGRYEVAVFEAGKADRFAVCLDLPEAVGALQRAVSSLKPVMVLEPVATFPLCQVCQVNAWSSWRGTCSDCT